MFVHSRGLGILFAAALVFCCAAWTAFAQSANGVLKAANERKAVPEITLQDSVGKVANLRDYRGKLLCSISGQLGAKAAKKRFRGSPNSNASLTSKVSP
jgi:hypothetical protein